MSAAVEEIKTAAKEVKEALTPQKKCCAKESCCEGMNNCVKCVCNTLSSIKAFVASKLSCAAEALKNPVVLLNTILVSTTLTTLLTGYAKYDKRYLQGKSDKCILLTAGAATAAIALDVMIY
ncbi:hypothetical protein TBLA_0A10050 [Henningerozyma blattae CBS 6284]|uniref:Mitochondrial outer membrane protein OM14 C-terminal domain-containing protein n=1 Tax=Henningerozyma blattae (strain ATCC 34711 / CBS 6284 / DSM 70876 / NBRC 10599 / NRRL Y-10934 / UCD 77-7) TaxID=1071380 RepID=I2GXD3_HENB6|nr:hypothetical protein TBLA_0A10050 [Tetrapisispora blattae CBS 6284]CCH58785.1 hypothetical protein TBLA_0A10050 [Tetrapisispora blattae CBS 6284]